MAASGNEASPSGWFAAAARRRWLRRTEPDLALVLELIARELRGGASLAGALAAVGDGVDPGLASVRQRVRDGAALGDEVDRWADSLPAVDAPLVRAVLGLGFSTGAALADALDRAAAVIRERRELVAELGALTAQSRASAAMIAAAPVGFLVVFGLADPAGILVLTTTPLGWACLAAGAALDGLGFWWMRRLVGAVA